MKFLPLFLLLFFSLSAFSKTGYVDLMAALEKTNQGKKMKARLEKSAQAVKRKLKAMELKIQQEEEGLKKEAPLLSEQARARKIQQLQQKFLDFQKEVKNKDMEFQKLQSSLMDPILEKLKKTIGETAQKESYTVIENIGQDVLWVAPKLDLTERVYKSFNKKYK